MSGNSKRENREIPMVSNSKEEERPENVSDGNAGMYAMGKSDGSIVPAKRANNGGAEPPAESVEERDPAKRNARHSALQRTQCRTRRRHRGVAGVREAFALDSRQEPYEVVPHVRICAGGRWQQRSLPRSSISLISFS